MAVAPFSCFDGGLGVLIRTGTSDAPAVAPAVALAVMTRGGRDTVRRSRPITQRSALRMRFEQVENAQYVRTPDDLHGLVVEAQSFEEAEDVAADEATEGEDQGTQRPTKSPSSLCPWNHR